MQLVCKNKFSTAAFTLIELSISILIIGLIVTSISSASKFIKTIKRNSVITDFYKYEQAINSFKSKYGYWPGDFPDAYVTFKNSSCTNATSPSGCNGDGNGIVNQSLGNSNEEILLAWQHLSLSGLIDSTYTGSVRSFPPGRYRNGYYALTYFNNYGNKLVGHALTYSKLATQLPNMNVLSSQDAYFIDLKMDDGLPANGKLFGLNSSAVSAGCPVASNLPNSSLKYNFSTSDAQDYCFLIFWLEKNV